MAYKELPISLLFQTCLKDRDFEQNERGWFVECCKKGRKTLFLNPERNVGNCPVCGLSGNTVSLNAKLMKITNKESFEKLTRLNGDTPIQEPLKARTKAASNNPFLINMFYKTLLSKLVLNDEDLKNLLNRGLNKKQIKELGCKSIPKTNLIKDILSTDEINYFKNLLKEEEDERGIIISIPGTYDWNDEPKLGNLGEDGYFVPIKDKQGLISCMQIRHNDNKCRYTFLSSSKEKTGCDFENINTLAFSNVLQDKGMYQKYPEKVFLTEGPLKGYVAHCLSGKMFISVPGVNSVKSLAEGLDFLKKQGTKTIVICFDMDYRDKKEVARALKKATTIVQESGLQCKIENWNPQFKGIDDYLLSKRRV